MVHSSRTLPPLDTLEAFTRAARAGSFSAAAEDLGLTHGAISRQVSRLERWMGVRLFQRAARGVSLTPEGSRFLARAEEALALLGEPTERWTPRRGPAMVKLSITPSLSSLWLFPRIREIERDDLHLELVLEHRLAEFSDGTELALRCGRGPWAGVRSIQLWREEARPIAAPCLAAKLGPSPAPGDLLQRPILHDSNIEGWRAWFAAAGISYAPRTQDRRFEDYNIVLDACRNGLGIALARQPVADDALAAGTVTIVSLRSAPYPVAFYLIRSDDPLRPAAAEVAGRLLRMAGKSEEDIAGFVAAGRRK
jgi:DNA-binding transcriptional LysR family regulator